MTTQSRQLAAIMFTDIVGYTALVDEDEKKALDLFAALVAPSSFSNFIRRASCAAKAVGAVKAATVFGITLSLIYFLSFLGLWLYC